MTIATAPPEQVTLYFKSGSSDKVYRCAIEPSGPGYIVSFAVGRRGSTLSTGRKTPQPVGYDEAKKIFDRLVKEKTAKGYTPGEAGTPYQQTDNALRSTGILPQLLNSIDEAEAEKLIADPAWLSQEKFDGRRVLIKRLDDTITGINRSGLVIALPEPVVTAARTIGSQHWVMDGECVGEVFHCFDLLENACADLRSQPYQQRLKTLFGLMPAAAGAIRSVETAVKAASKREMLQRLREQKKEGIVFKRLDAPYTPGRPASGGDQLKLKFTATASCIVAGVNGSKRSVKLELLDHGRRVGVGSVTIPPSQKIPAAGQIVETRYLYAHVGGSLFQPVYLGVRDDISIDACTVGQLKFKADTDVDEGG